MILFDYRIYSADGTPGIRHDKISLVSFTLSTDFSVSRLINIIQCSHGRKLFFLLFLKIRFSARVIWLKLF